VINEHAPKRKATEKVDAKITILTDQCLHRTLFSLGW
jgi:hypothetical protein